MQKLLKFILAPILVPIQFLLVAPMIESKNRWRLLRVMFYSAFTFGDKNAFWLSIVCSIFRTDLAWLDSGALSETLDNKMNERGYRWNYKSGRYFKSGSVKNLIAAINESSNS